MDDMTILLCFTSLFSRVLSHQQHLVRTKGVWSLGSVRWRWCECNHLSLARHYQCSPLDIGPLVSGSPCQGLFPNDQRSIHYPLHNIWTLLLSVCLP